MPTPCNDSDMNAAFKTHKINEPNFNTAILNYYIKAEFLIPILVSKAEIKSLLDNANCDEHCIVFTVIDSIPDLSIRCSVFLNSDRLVDGKYKNDPGLNEMQTTFSFELLSYVVEHSKAEEFEFFKGRSGSSKRLHIKFLDKTTNLPQFLNYGDIGPMKAGGEVSQ